MIEINVDLRQWFINRLIRRVRLISKFMTSQLGNEELQYRHCSISQEVKAIKFGQLAEYNMKNIFLGK